MTSSPYLHDSCYYSLTGLLTLSAALIPVNSMQRMLQELERFAAETNMTFSTDTNPAKSKSKCIYVTGNRRNVVNPAPLVLCGRDLPWVDQADHLGSTLTSRGDMDQDAVIKRAKFISSSCEIREMFKFAAPLEIIKALKIYSSSFYGSSLWDLGGDKAKQVFSAWDTAVKLIWNCPQWTRSYILQQILYCGQPSAKVEILSRYLKFFNSLLDSASHEVQVMARFAARDVRTTTANNLRVLKDILGVSPWKRVPSDAKDTLVDALTTDVPEEDYWRLPYFCSLIRQRRLARDSGHSEDEERLNQLICSLVKN